jgi:hypothetical protein
LIDEQPVSRFEPIYVLVATAYLERRISGEDRNVHTSSIIVRQDRGFARAIILVKITGEIKDEDADA